MRSLNGKQLLMSLLVISFNLMALANESGDVKGGEDKCNASLVKAKKTDSPVSKIEEKVELPKATHFKTEIRNIKLSSLASSSPDNPILTYPSIVMTAAQKYYAVLTIKPPEVARDPVFGVENIKMYPALTGDVIPLSGMIIGQYAALEALVSYVESEAKGDQGGKIFGVVGPSGTGKTYTFEVLDRLRKSLANTDPKFIDVSFKWVGLEKIPKLGGLVPKLRAPGVPSEIEPDLKRSPFTLLRSDIQDAVIDALRPRLEEASGFALRVWKKPAPKDQEIIEAVLEFTYKDVADGVRSIDDLTAEEYVTAIEPYVKVIPRPQTKSGASDIVGYLGDNPNFERLYTSPNPLRSVLYSGTSPLAYDYTGTILQQDGGSLILDEAPRNTKEVLDSLLDLVQNGVARSDGPPVALDVVGMFTGNDQSIESAKQNGDLNAFIDRSNIVPMRLNLHPWEVAKTALLLVGPKQFKMRALESFEATQLEPLDLNKAFPKPTREGKLVGVHRRYALYYTGDSRSEPILISPHALEMLALTASITRLVVDPKVLAKYSREFEKVSPGDAYFSNPVNRIRMMLGQDSVPTAIRIELAKFSALAREGEVGISARNTQTWFKKAIDMAKDNGDVLTPEVMDFAFKKLINDGTIAIPDATLRASWLERYGLVKSQFIMPWLIKDIQEIVAGHGERAARLYDTVVSEIIALSQDQAATSWQPDNAGAEEKINLERLTKIKIKFAELHGKEFTPGFLLSHLANANQNSERYVELLRAVESYITETQLDIADAAQGINDFYLGKSVSPDVQAKALAIEKKLNQYGYSQQSFMAALRYWKILNFEAANKKPKEN